jgi:ABC-type lipoprotein export system ATPase subunit
MAFIELQKICKTYRLGELEVPVLKGISVAIQPGELVALTGASGSGKSTLMNILGCLDHPTSGHYFLDGRDVSGLTADERAFLRNHKIGFVFQNFNLLPRTDALDNVMIPLTYSAEDISDDQSRERAMGLLKRVGLTDRFHHEPSQLSGGQQQRVAIARALINRPSLLLADEPTGNLDTHTSVEMMQLFQELNRDDGITILIVTHNPEVARYTRRVIGISDGVLTDGEPLQHAQKSVSQGNPPV